MPIRFATREDAEVLAALEGECFAEPWSQTALREAIDDEKYCVLLAQSETQNDLEILGYVFGWSIGEEGELARVGVQQKLRGQGWGEKLLRAFLSELRSHSTNLVFLEVRQSNQTAQRLYSRCGFEPVGLRRKYYADGEDAIVMRAEIGKG